jgi:hypothetical protein
MSNLYPQNLSQFKKWLKPGNKIEVLLNIYKPEFIGLVRDVAEVQTNGVWFVNPDKTKGNLWLSFEKASKYKFNGDVVSIMENLYSSTERDQLKIHADKQDVVDSITKRIADRKSNLIKDGAKFIDDDTYICIEYRFIDSL